MTSFSLAVFAKQRAEVAADAGIPVVQESVKVEEQASAEPADKADAAAGEAESGKADLPELE